MTKAASLFRDRSYLLLIGGGVFSLLGDQLTVIALPFLVLRWTGDPSAMATALAALTLPRALLLPVGGAIVDRVSSKKVLFATDCASAAGMAGLAFLVQDGGLSSALLLFLSLFFGIVSAFAFPAGSTIIAHVVAPAFLRQANAIFMALRQLCLVVGPVAASLVFAFAREGEVGGFEEIRRSASWAFFLDALSFVVSAATLIGVAVRTMTGRPERFRPIFQEIKLGCDCVLNDKSLRALSLYSAAVAFFVLGPLRTAMPLLGGVLSDNGPVAFGILGAAQGGGALLGMIIPSWLFEQRRWTFGTTVLAADLASGTMLLCLGRTGLFWEAVSLTILLGFCGGLVQVEVFSWVQLRVPQEMIGRVMSIFIFMFFAIFPISSVLAGFALRYVDVGSLLTFSGGSLIIVVLVMGRFSQIRRIDHELISEVISESESLLSGQLED